MWISNRIRVKYRALERKVPLTNVTDEGAGFKFWEELLNFWPRSSALAVGGGASRELRAWDLFIYLMHVGFLQRDRPGLALVRPRHSAGQPLVMSASCNSQLSGECHPFGSFSLSNTYKFLSLKKLKEKCNLEDLHVNGRIILQGVHSLWINTNFCQNHSVTSLGLISWRICVSCS